MPHWSRHPCQPIRGKLPVDWLLEEYTRSDRLGDCLRLLFARGAVLRDPVVATVLLNDANKNMGRRKKFTVDLAAHHNTGFWVHLTRRRISDSCGSRIRQLRRR